MKKQTNTGFPTNLLFVDCETKGVIDREDMASSKHYLWFGYCTAFEYRDNKRTRHKSMFFTTIEEFWRFAETRVQKGKPLYIFAHNITFDLTVLDVWRLSEQFEWNVEFAVIDDPPVIVKFDIHGKKVVLLDTFNYFKCSVADLGESIGLPKQEMPKNLKNMEVWKKYCKRDVDIICDSTLRMFDYFRKNELGNFAYTIAGLAINTYKKRFMKNEIFIHDNPRALQLERDSYFGGLVENYFIGEVKNKAIYCMDVNSMYPYVMQKDYPCKLVCTKSNPNISDVQRKIQKYSSIAKVLINSNRRTYPVKHDGKLIYANGTFCTCLTGVELEEALQRADISSIEYISYYESAPIFRDYVDYFWKERAKHKLNKDKVNELFCKYLLNSLYGKFGQQLNTWQPLTLETLYYLYNAYAVDYPEEYKYKLPEVKIKGIQGIWYPLGFTIPVAVRKVSTQTQVRIPRGEHHESFPAIAAYVTAYGRQYLRTIHTTAGHKNVYYCDTDSIIGNQTAYRNLVTKGYVSETMLGSCKVEMKCNYAMFYGLKDYILGNKIKTKGVRKDAIQLSENEFMQNQFEGLKSILKREREPYVRISWITKLLSRNYSKGIVSKSGWVTPITL